MTQAATWSDLQTTTMTRMWDAGHSGTEISDAVGKPRNAVLGKIYRMYDAGFPFTRERMKNADRIASRRTVKQQPTGARKRSKKRAEVHIARAAALAEPYVEVAAKPWTERAFGECAFPVGGQGADTLSCCAKTPEKATYCLRHQAIMYTPSIRPALDRADFRRSNQRRAA